MSRSGTCPDCGRLWDHKSGCPRTEDPCARLFYRSNGENVARATIVAEREAEAVRLLDALQRDDAAVQRVRNAIGWIW